MSRRTRALLGALALLLALGFAAQARAQIVHTVVRGDTLARLAQHYYGSSSKAADLAGVNQSPLDAKLKPGEDWRNPRPQKPLAGPRRLRRRSFSLTS